MIAKPNHPPKNDKIAFLILAHTDQNQLIRLINSLDDARFDFYIHIDLKSKEFLYDTISKFIQHSKLYFIKRRKLYWGDISIVDATIDLYKEALKNGGYFRFVTLSGLDYPIENNDFIYKTFKDESIEFIKGNQLEKKDYHKVLYRYYWKLGKIGKLITILSKKLHLQSRSLNAKLENNEELRVYFAPQWHALSYGCVRYVVDLIDSNKSVRRFFRYSYAPDELLIPTIVFNSRFKNNALQSSFKEGTHYNDKIAIHYINYEPIVQTLTIDDYNQIINSKKLFFRKANSDKSKELLDQIDILRKK